MNPHAADLRARAAQHRRRRDEARRTAVFEWDAAREHLDRYFAALREADRHQESADDAEELARVALAADRTDRRRAWTT